MSSQQERDIKKLNALLRGELSAVETYAQCIEKIDEPKVSGELSVLCDSHRARVAMLREEIMTMGAEPETSSGAWGAFAKLVQGGANVFGTKAAISTLEEGEDHGKKEYDDLEDISPNVRRFIESRLRPEQIRTHDQLSALENAVTAA